MYYIRLDFILITLLCASSDKKGFQVHKHLVACLLPELERLQIQAMSSHGWVLFVVLYLPFTFNNFPSIKPSSPCSSETCSSYFHINPVKCPSLSISLSKQTHLFFCFITLQLNSFIGNKSIELLFPRITSILLNLTSPLHGILALSIVSVTLWKGVPAAHFTWGRDWLMLLAWWDFSFPSFSGKPLYSGIFSRFESFSSLMIH